MFYISGMKRDRAISAKVLARRLYAESSSTFPKNCFSTIFGGCLEFLRKTHLSQNWCERHQFWQNILTPPPTRPSFGYLQSHRTLFAQKSSFIALIHPIQWTIALPVGTTGPDKRQKKTSCIYNRQDPSQSVHSLGGASYFLPV